MSCGTELRNRLVSVVGSITTTGSFLRRDRLPILSTRDHPC
jgi:hypothetical protein